MFDISNKLSAISREKISRLKRSSASLRAFSPMRRAEGKCFYESGQSYGVGEVQTADDDAAFAGYQFSQFVGNHSVGVADVDGVGH